MRDVVFDLKQLNIDHAEHYEWQKQIRLTWNGRENGCKVDCGAWTTYQGNEYLGSIHRLALTPLTTRYFVFISSAFREKSAVLFRCIPDHAKAEDIFHEFSNVCTTPFKGFDCNKNMSMRHLMQYLNGAALASIWVFFEHIDKLNYINLQTFNKEIQMVQQQFIIAELSQDSSVITAHITVGNHSHSQAQRSIEQRFNPQRALNLDENDRQQDIKIEDNFHNEENIENEEVSEDEEIMPTRPRRFEEMKDDTEEPLEEDYERPLIDESEGNISGEHDLNGFKDNLDKKMLENVLSDDKNYQSNKNIKHKEVEDFDEFESDIEQEFKRKQREISKDDESSPIKAEDKIASNDTTNDEASKMNKICFGVFASISHEFILNNPHKADEISLSLQSAFRVISLTRPEYKIILKTLLKCEGIKNYEDLGNGVLEFVKKIRESAPPGVTNMHFSFTYYDVQAIVKAIGHLTEQNWKEKDKKFSKLRKEMIDDLDDPIGDYRNKQIVEDKKAQNETKIDSQEKSERSKIEYDATCKTLELYAIQRCLYDWYVLRKKQSNVQEIDIEHEIIAKSQQILHKIFKEKSTNIKTKADEIQKQSEMSIEKVITSFEKENGINLSSFMKGSVQRFYKLFQVSKRIAIVGPICSGKSTLLKVISYAISKLLNKILNYSVISPKTFTYGELYGSTDNIQAYSSDIKSRDSIYSIILDKYAQMDASEKEKVIKSIVIDSDIEEVDTECTIQNSMRLQKTDELDNEFNKSYIRFPNGIILDFPHDFYFFYETDTLRNSSPRFVASVSVVMTHEKFISWREIIKNNTEILVNQNTSFFKMFSITKQSLLRDFEKVVVAIVDKFEKQYDELPLMWDKRMHTLNFFKIFKAYLAELKVVILRKVKKNPQIAKETIDYYQSRIGQTLNSFILISLIWSFSGILDVKNKRKFENVAASVELGHKLNLVTTNKSENLSFFDLIFDYERMHWITVTDLDDYCVPVKMDKDNLIVLTDDYLKYSNFVSFLLKNSTNCDFGLIIAGDTPTFKSTIMKSISNKHGSNKLWLPMSSYITLPHLKTELSNFAGGVMKKNDDCIIFVDDLHLQSNLKVDILEYFRMWTKNRGHYNVKSKTFDSLSNLKTVMTFDIKYGLQSSKLLKNIDISQNRYTYYSHSVYIPPIHRNKMRRIFQGIVNYRLDSLFEHPLNGLHVPLIQSLMTVDEYFRKNVVKLKYSQFNNPNNIFTKKRLLETILTRALDKEEDIDTPQLVAEVVLSLTNQFYLLRIIDPLIKSRMYQDINEILIKEFKLNRNELGENGLAKKDVDNLQKIIKHQAKNKSSIWLAGSIGADKQTVGNVMSIQSLDESRRLLEQIECGIRYHIIMAPEIINTFETLRKFSFATFFDAYGIREAIQTAIKMGVTKKGLHKKVVLYVNTTHHSDIVYADFLNLIISYPEERSVFREKTFIEKLSKIFKQILEGEDKENSRYGKDDEGESNFSFDAKALEYIQNNLVIIIQITTLQVYYQWISFFPNLEKICSVRFINSSTKPKELLNSEEESNSYIEQEKVVASCNFTEGFVRDFVFKHLMKPEEDEDSPIDIDNGTSERVVLKIKDLSSEPTSKLKVSRRLSQKPSEEKQQIFKDPETFNSFPQKSMINEVFFSEARFKNFVELFNNLHNKIKTNLLKTKSFSYKYKEK